MLHPWRCKLIYQMFAKLLSWMVLHARSDTAKEIEILVLRHPHPRAWRVAGGSFPLPLSQNRT
jgi:hypothetical protein